MQSNTIETIKLTPTVGKYITQKYVADEKDRVFSKELYINPNANINDWIEVDISKKDEYDKMMKEKQDIIDAENAVINDEQISE